MDYKDSQRTVATASVRVLRDGGGPTVALLPFAGAASHSLRALADSLPAEWCVLGVDPPGHGRNHEPLVHRFDELLDACDAALSPHREEISCLFGHSLGGMLAFRLAARWETASEAPQAVVVSSTLPPDRFGPHVHALLRLDDEALVRGYAELGGWDPELMEDPEFATYIAPLLRADSAACSSFVDTGEALVAPRLTVLAGIQDRVVSPQQLESWRRYAQELRFVGFAGAHMYLLREAVGVAREIAASVAETLEVCS